MTKWEYAVLHGSGNEILIHEQDGNVRGHKTGHFLNILGAQGWELITALPTLPDKESSSDIAMTHTLFLKRPLSEDSA